MQEVTTISGIVSCYIFEMNHKKYYLFGDKHFTRAGNCKDAGYLCDHFDKTFSQTHTYGSSCTTIGALLHNWFTYNNDHNIKTDFYLEAIYTKNDAPYYTHFTDIIENRKKYATNIENKKYTSKNFKDNITYNNVNDNKYFKNDVIQNNITKNNVKDNFFTIEENDAPFQDRSWMELMSIIRQPCFIREKTGCPYYPNVHSHYIDVRLVNTTTGLKNVSPFSFSLLNNVPNVLEYIKMFIVNYKIILDDFLSPYGFTHFVNYIDLPEEIREEFISDISLFTVVREIDGKKVQMYKAAWELYRLKQKDSVLAEQLTTFMYHKAALLIQNIIREFTTDIKNNVIDRNYYIKKYSTLFQDLEIILMDSYALSRVFLQDDSEEIIIYAGNYHIRVYAEFFNYLQYPLLLSATGNNCLKMPDLPLYLDANIYRQYVMEKQGTTPKTFDIKF